MTPLSTVYLKLVSALAIMIPPIISQAQQVEQLDSLESNLTEYYGELKEAELKEYEGSNSLKWLLFVPGIGYDFINQNPYITYNSSSLLSYFSAKVKAKNKREAISFKNHLELNKASIKLKRLYLKLSGLLEQYSIEREILKKYRSLYAIKKGAYNNDELKLEELIRFEIQLKGKEKGLYSLADRIQDTALQIEGLTNDELQYTLE